MLNIRDSVKIISLGFCHKKKQNGDSQNLILLKPHSRNVLKNEFPMVVCSAFIHHNTML